MRFYSMRTLPSEWTARSLDEVQLRCYVMIFLFNSSRAPKIDMSTIRLPAFQCGRCTYRRNWIHQLLSPIELHNESNSVRVVQKMPNWNQCGNFNTASHSAKHHLAASYHIFERFAAYFALVTSNIAHGCARWRNIQLTSKTRCIASCPSLKSM